MIGLNFRAREQLDLIDDGRIRISLPFWIYWGGCCLQRKCVNPKGKHIRLLSTTNTPTKHVRWRGCASQGVFEKMSNYHDPTRNFRQVHCNFKLALALKSRPCRGTFARANQADRRMNLLHCAERSTPWLQDTGGCDRDVECFSLFDRYVTLPVGTWSIALEQTFRSLFTWLARYSVVRNITTSFFGGNFSVVSLQLTVQFPFLNVFSSFILPLRACQKRAFNDVGAVGAGAERGVNTRQADRSPQGLRSTKICDHPSPRPDQRRLLVCLPRSWSDLRELVKVFADRTRNVDWKFRRRSCQSWKASSLSLGVVVPT